MLHVKIAYILSIYSLTRKYEENQDPDIETSKNLSLRFRKFFLSFFSPLIKRKNQNNLDLV